MTVACLMGTYGRYRFACDALACFLQQTALSEATLLIYNQHPIPLSFDHPRVRVVNETLPGIGLRRIRERMLELTDPDVEFIHWWDDDDLILPWHLEACLEHIGTRDAWKPRRSWTEHGGGLYSLDANIFEATAIYRASVVRAVPLDIYPDYPDHPANMLLNDEGRVASTERGDLSSYLYRWANGIKHLSHYAKTKDGPVANVTRLRERMVDTGDGKALVAADLWPRWNVFLDGIKDMVSPEGLDEINARLSIAGAMATMDL